MHRFRIKCGDAMHTVELTPEGALTFHEHPDAFAAMDRERAVAVLAGSAAPQPGDGCLRLALLVREGRLSPAVPGGDDARRLLSVLRGIRLGRKIRKAG